MSAAFDPRITAARADVADAALEGQLEARRYVVPEAHRVTTDAALLRFSADPGARTESQLVFGETFNVLDRADGFCWGQNLADGYVGYVEEAALAPGALEPSHVVAVATSQRYPEPDIKAPPLGLVGLGASVRVEEQRDAFCRGHDGDWFLTRHLRPIDRLEADFIRTGLMLLGRPYLWGGRSAVEGLDCSAFVQLCLAGAGIAAPRDSDMQERELGEAPAGGLDLNDIREGDLMFFPGHVGFVIDGWRFLHANAFDMQVSLHNLSDVLDRAKSAGQPPTSIRRLAGFESPEED